MNLCFAHTSVFFSVERIEFEKSKTNGQISISSMHRKEIQCV